MVSWWRGSWVGNGGGGGRFFWDGGIFFKTILEHGGRENWICLILEFIYNHSIFCSFFFVYIFDYLFFFLICK